MVGAIWLLLNHTKYHQLLRLAVGKVLAGLNNDCCYIICFMSEKVEASFSLGGFKK